MAWSASEAAAIRSRIHRVRSSWLSRTTSACWSNSAACTQCPCRVLTVAATQKASAASMPSVRVNDAQTSELSRAASARSPSSASTEASSSLLRTRSAAETCTSSERQSFPYAPPGGRPRFADAAGQPDPRVHLERRPAQGVTEQPQFLQRAPLVLVVAENPVKARQLGQRVCGSAGVSVI